MRQRQGCDRGGRIIEKRVVVARAGECGTANQPFGAGPILDHDRLLPALAQLFSKWAGGTVGAGREWHDYANRALRPWLRGNRRSGRDEAEHETRRQHAGPIFRFAHGIPSAKDMKWRMRPLRLEPSLKAGKRRSGILR